MKEKQKAVRLMFTESEHNLLRDYVVNLSKRIGYKITIVGYIINLINKDMNKGGK